MFGFLCNQNGKKLCDADIEDTFKNIGIKEITERIQRKHAQQLATNFGEKSNIALEKYVRRDSDCERYIFGGDWKSQFPACIGGNL